MTSLSRFAWDFPEFSPESLESQEILQSQADRDSGPPQGMTLEMSFFWSSVLGREPSGVKR